MKWRWNRIPAVWPISRPLTQTPKVGRALQGQQATITWIGHSSFLAEFENFRVLSCLATQLFGEVSISKSKARHSILWETPAIIQSCLRIFNPDSALRISLLSRLEPMHRGTFQLSDEAIDEMRAENQ